MYEVFSSTEGGTKVSLLAIVGWYLLRLLLVVGKSVKNVQEFFFYARANNARIWKATRFKYCLS